MIDADAVVTIAGANYADAGPSETDPPAIPIELEEHDSTDPFPISEPDREFLESLSGDSDVLSISYTAEGTAVLHSSSYEGVVTLPSGIVIEVSPKETVSNLLYLLQYAFDVPTSTIEQTTGLKAAETFIDAFGALFHAELAAVLRQGIRRDYQRVQSIEQEVRGRLDVQRQIQRPTAVPTDFAVEYDTFTSDTALNRAVHQATRILTALVSDDSLSGQLVRQEKSLRKFVSLASVSREELSTIEITRLNEYYADLLELTRIVLSRRFFEDLRGGERESYGLFVDMNAIFENVVERAFREAAEEMDRGWSVEGQATIRNLISGPHAIDMRPDFVVRGTDGETVVIGDAKWKTGNRAPSDVYQMTSYMLTEHAPGLLVYPGTGDIGEQSEVRTGEVVQPIRSIELSTATPASTYQEYQGQLISSATKALEKITDRNV